MIIDNIDRLNEYRMFFEPNTFLLICSFLQNRQKNNFGTLVELNNRKLYARILRLDTLERSSCQFETHHIYTDLQCIIGGSELIDWAPNRTLQVNGKYDDTNDIQFYLPGEPILTIDARKDFFVLFNTMDAHRPQIRAKSFDYVEKIVFKVHKSLLINQHNE